MNIQKLYENYGTYLVEQKGVISKDLDGRLFQYLEVDEIRQIITDATNDTEEGKKAEGEITKDSASFIKKDDIVKFEIDKTDMSNIKVTAFVYNPEASSTKIDFETAAYFINDAIDGIGTDEDQVAQVGTAMALLSLKDGADTGEYFDKLDQEYESKYGESLTDAIEGDFEGNGEAVALNIFRRKIEKNDMRGLDIQNILFDIGLTAATFGAGTAALKGLTTVPRIANYASKVKNVAKGFKELPKMIGRLKGFKKLSKTSKLRAFNKSHKVGDTLTWTSAANNTAKVTIKEITKTGVKFEGQFGKQAGKQMSRFTKNFDEFIAGLPPKKANKILNFAKVPINVPLATLAAKKTAEAASASAEVSGFATFTEVMGWYSTAAADPESFIQSIQGEEMKSLAMRMKDLSSGITNMGDELSMALIVTSLRPDAVKKLNSEYEKISNDGNSMLQDLEYESSYFGTIDSDVTTLISIYVKGVLGQDAKVMEMYNKLKKS